MEWKIEFYILVVIDMSYYRERYIEKFCEWMKCKNSSHRHLLSLTGLVQ
jgi:hypothetical protein